MVNAFARLGDRILRGVLPKAEAQACAYIFGTCYDVTCPSGGECYGCCKNSCGHYVCTVDYYGTLLGCSILSC